MTDIWQRLKCENKPILLWGTGNGADKILAELDRLGIVVSGVFASDGFVRNRSYQGFPVLSLKEAEERFGDFTALFSFGSSRPEVLENIKTVMSKHTLLAPEVPVAGGEIFNLDYAHRHKKEIETAYSLLADDKSREVFRETLLFKLDGDIGRLFCSESDEDELFSLLDLKAGSSFLDLGAYNGDTVLQFARTVGNFSHITAIEPDRKSFMKLMARTEKLGINALNAAVCDKVGTVSFKTSASRGSSIGEGAKIPAVTVDFLAAERSFDYIKFDVEGAEEAALIGAERTILRDRPKMRIAAYHKSDDYFTIPLLVSKYRGDYKIYMRHLPSVPAWDTDYIFV